MCQRQYRIASDKQSAPWPVPLPLAAGAYAAVTADMRQGAFAGPISLPVPKPLAARAYAPVTDVAATNPPSAVSATPDDRIGRALQAEVPAPMPLAAMRYASERRLPVTSAARRPARALPVVAASLPVGVLAAGRIRHGDGASGDVVVSREVSLVTGSVPRPSPIERPGTPVSRVMPPLRVDGGFQPVLSGAGHQGGIATADRALPARTLTEKIKPFLRFAAYAVAAWFVLILSLMVLFRFVNPPMSSLMLQQRLIGTEIRQTWVGLDQISPRIVRAVLVSEDGRFCQHRGIDFAAMQDAIGHVGKSSPRGASTISMQVIKNLFLWPSRSYLRKAIEIPLTWLLEILWPKKRIMEVYLNIAEWGPGVFGVEEASRYHFNTSARRLDLNQASLLAVALPNPYMRVAGDPGPKTRKLAWDIQRRMRNAFRGQTSCVVGGRR